MARPAFLPSISLTSLTLLLLVTSCNIRPPFVVSVGAVNSNTSPEPRNVVCTGGVRTRVTVQDRTVETALAPPEDSRTVQFTMPENAPAGTTMKTEAWCYGADNAELAYVRVSRPYIDTKLLTVDALAPFSPPIAYGTCQPATETRGPEICIQSSMYD